MFYIDFNGTTSNELGVAVTTRPAIPTPQPRGEYVQVAGRDGALLVTDGTYENIEILVEMNFVRRPDWIAESYRKIKMWLTGGGILRMSDDTETFYKVKACTVTGYGRKTRFGSEIEATFSCDPYVYFDSGLKAISPGDIYNPYATATPLYKITGEGICTLTVNGNTMTANVAQNVTIDTNLYLAYRTDGTNVNMSVTGDFDTLWLNPGDNTVSVTKGFNLEIIPNWRSL